MQLAESGVLSLLSSGGKTSMTEPKSSVKFCIGQNQGSFSIKSHLRTRGAWGLCVLSFGILMEAAALYISITLMRAEPNS